MQRDLKFSIITVSKNNKAGLLRAIDCVRNQTYKNIEHIIVDGSSTDGSAEAIESEQLKIKNSFLLTTNYSLLTISEADSGIYDAINKGIKLATGDVIGLLHSDDLYADEKVIEKYVSTFGQPTTNHKQPTIDAVYSDLVYVRMKREVRSENLEAMNSKTTNHSLLLTTYSVIRYWMTHPRKMDSGSESGMTTSGYQSLITDHLLRKGWMPPHPTLFLRKEVFEKYGLYNTDLKIASDYEMILRLLYKHKITAYYLPVTTYLMSVGGASNKNPSNIFTKSKEDYLAMKMHGISSPFLTLVYKNLRKLPQFMARGL